MIFRCEVQCDHPDPHAWIGYVEALTPMDAVDIIHDIVHGCVKADVVKPYKSSYALLQREWGDHPLLGSHRLPSVCFPNC